MDNKNTALLNQFNTYLSVEKRYSQYTCISYKTDLLQFFDYILTNYSIENIQELDTQIIRSWLAEMVEINISAKTINRKLSALRSFFNYNIKTKNIFSNPTDSIKLLKTKKSIPEFIEEHQIKKLFEIIQFEGSLENKTIYLILQLFYCTGIRLSELLHLKIANIDLHNLQIKVLGKGNKERIIPIPNTLVENCNLYINSLKFNDHNSLLFTNKKGEKLNPKKIYNWVHQQLSGITTIHKKSPHILRHSYATHLLHNGAEINAVKELLGHSSLAATQIYTHHTIHQLKEVYKNAHPKSGR